MGESKRKKAIRNELLDDLRGEGYDIRTFEGEDAQRILSELRAAEDDAPWLAHAFITRLIREVSSDQLQEIKRINGITHGMPKCASYGFCNSDELMLKAFYDVGILRPGEKYDTSNMSHYALWNCAWDYAIEKFLTDSGYLSLVDAE